ncbi:Gfo/Idh/MocA family oxidoreductase [Lentimicrobium sp. L6]|uniref:Gfo/Idh/MocA family oxidoreductase n=1 Tax=Lentimicrobium sp. L6 TaxID=2735916 RepID=UPI001552B8D0|nr:Gfo/Idh/MocA family oxidoreductase [Lentimicrobium sp. L6]NPD83749.1 Gfo/Idh/MocA family oxidoreductase [Lentimicrobium sp. L6]
MSKLNIGLLGAGHLGKIHLKCIRQVEDFNLIGFFDPNEENGKKVEAELEVKRFSSIKELINASDAIDIVTPTMNHFECAEMALKAGKHVFIEKPVASSPEEAERLLELEREFGVKVQVGHVERFNPAFVAVQNKFDSPMFIETHRLAQFNPRGTDVPVVLDLMIHDLDIILSTVKSKLVNVSASGVNVVSDTPDIANARLEFENGCVANLTASRISMKNMRKSRFFQKNAYISVDFLTKESEIVSMSDVDENDVDPLAMILELGEGKTSKEIHFEKPVVEESNAIVEELTSFAKSIINDIPTAVTLNDGYQALLVAHQIVEKIKS